MSTLSNSLPAALCLLAAGFPLAQAAEPDASDKPVQEHTTAASAEAVRPQRQGNVIAQIDLRDISVGDALRMLSDETGVNIVASEKATQIKTALFLTNVRAMDVLDALAKAYNLWYQKDPATGIVRVYTVDEFRLGQVDAVRDHTEIFTLRYPNAVDVAYAIRGLFGTRVSMNLGTEQQEVIRELAARFQRFDMIDGRAQQSGGSGGRSGGGGGMGSMGGIGGMGGMNGMGGMGAMGGMGGMSTAPRTDIREQFPTSQDFAKDKAATGLLAGSDAEGKEVMQRLSPIYITVIRSQNRLMVRSRDPEAMGQIRELVNKLDISQSSLLLEVKVLSVDLSDGFDSVFKFDAKTLGDFAGSALLPGAGGFGGTLLARFVNDKFEAQMKLAQSEGRVTSLATPMLLTTNQEVSQVRVGQEVPIITGFTTPTCTGSGLSVVCTKSSPVYEVRPIGTTLLLTPNINADRSVTIRVVIQQASVVPGGASIIVPETFDEKKVDVTTDRSYSGTLVGVDGMAIAVGGLIEDEIADRESKVPILGDIPGVGMLFREDRRSRGRKELVVIMRPMVQTTPNESASVSQELVERSSAHPAASEMGEGPKLYETNPAKRNRYELNPERQFLPLE